MIKKPKSFFFVFSLIILVFYAFFFFKNKGSIKVEISNNKSAESAKSITTFDNVQYKSLDEKNREYITEAKKAEIKNSEPNIINLFDVKSFAKLKDGTFLYITSKEATFFKNTKNIFYNKNVILSNADKKIISNNAKYFYKKNLIELSGNIIMKDAKSKILADIVKLNTLNNNVEIMMLSKKDQVYGQREQKK